MESRGRIEEIYRQVIEIGKKYDVEKIVLFGSRARKTNQIKSDIDIAVYGCNDFVNFQYEIEENVWTLLKFDMIDMSQKYISETLIEEIERDGVILYEKI